MLKHFSIYEREKNRKNSVAERKKSRLSAFYVNNNANQRSSVMNQDMMNSLIRLGFRLEKLIIAHKIYKFQTLDEAISILTRDTDTKLYNHRFVRTEDDITNLNPNKCSICDEVQNQHLDFFAPNNLYPLQPNSNNSSSRNNNYNNNLQTKISSANENTNLQNASSSHLNLSNNPLKTNTKSINDNEEYTVNNLLIKKDNLGKANLIPNICDSSDKFVNKNFIHNEKIKECLVPKEIISELENPNLCVICFDSDTSRDPAVKFQCSHIFCLKCVKNYLEKNIENGKVLNINCLSGGCPLKIKEEIVNHIVDEAHSRKYVKFYKEQMRKMNSGNNKVVNCPYPDCEEILAIDPTYETRFFTCDNMHEFCALCRKVGWHQETDCLRYDENVLLEINRKIGGNKYKQCPNCYVIIEKNEGCNHMTCINCQFEFCWLCLRKYSEDHYAIYNIIGCPGMKYDDSTAHRIRQSWVLRILWGILVFFLGLLTILLVVGFFLFLGCPYEFVKCYLDKSNSEEDEDNESFSDYENNRNQDRAQENKELTFKDYFIIVILIMLGILLQPLYLLFYILMGLVEFYRQCGCWVFWAYSS